MLYFVPAVVSLKFAFDICVVDSIGRRQLVLLFLWVERSN